MDTRVRKIGNGYGVLLPKQMMDELRLEVGSVLSIVKDAEGIRLSPYDAGFSEQLEAFRRTEARHRNSYRELSK
jgi:antitoxin component of MazEF toxin-antitoxin module